MDWFYSSPVEYSQAAKMQSESTFLRLPVEQNGSSMVNQITMDPDGNLVFFEKNWNEETTFYYIKTCSPDKGELISRLDVTSFLRERELYLYQGWL